MLLARSDGRPWDTGSVEEMRQKLAFRASLPGAFAFDQAAHGFRIARHAGVPCRELLAAACASSWLVNSGAPSTTFRRWLEPPFDAVLGELAEALAARPCAWASYADDERGALEGAMNVLAFEPRALGTLTKVLALLAPESVPILADAALRFAGVLAAEGDGTFDAQTAPASCFGPAMTWFTACVVAHEAELAEVARSLRGPPLAPAQVLDRLLWFDAEGRRHRDG